MCLAREKEVLLDRIAEIEIGGIGRRGALTTFFLEIGLCGLQSLQIWKRDEMAEWGIPLQRLDTKLSFPSFNPSLTLKEEKRMKG
jgi:hypothetical protein